MAVPTVGKAEMPVMENQKKREVKKLARLEKDSGESIFSLLFTEKEKDGLK